jgi:heptosyltransferase II
MKIGIFLPNWIGDVVMATPTLRAVRTHFGESSQLVGIMKPYVVDVLKGTSWLDQTLLYDRQSRDPALQSPALVRRIFQFRFDLVLLLPNTFRSALFAWLGRARERVGYVRYGRGPFLTHRLYPARENGRYVPCPTLDYYLALAYAVGCPKEAPQMELATTLEDEAAADRALSMLGVRPGEGFVLLNSSGAFGAAKLWPDQYFADLGRRIYGKVGQQVLVLCGPQERHRAAQIAALAGSPGVKSTSGLQLSIGLSKALVRRSLLLVTTDSGPRHFAAAFNVPVITLFGPTHIAWSDTYYAKETKLQLQLECGPCQQRTCSLAYQKCMQDLSVEMVYEAVQAELS